MSVHPVPLLEYGLARRMSRNGCPVQEKMQPQPPSHFWRKLIVFLLPFAAAFFALTGVLVYLGESMPLSWVVSLQQRDDSVLYRPMYGNRDQQFKLMSVNARRPEVLALGSSRILQFRAGFFNRRPEAFYNAAAPAWRLEQVADLLYSISEDALPRILILAIDPPWFNDAYEGDTFPGAVSDIEQMFLADRSVLQDILTGRDLGRPGFAPADYLRRAEPGGSGGLALGLRAIRDGHGFRSDGSEQYGDFLVAGWLWQPQMRENHIAMMRRGEDMYVFGDTVSATALADLARLLDFAVEHDITVIGFLPAYAPDLWDRMIARGNHTYVSALTPRLAAEFAARDFPFFDFSDGASVATGADEFFDGWHASELSNLRLYLKLLEALPAVLGEYSDYDTLSAVARNASDTWRVFGLGNELP